MNDLKDVVIILSVFCFIIFIVSHPWIILLVVCGIITILLFNKIKTNNEVDKLHSTQGYINLKNLLEDCTHVNKDFRLINITFEQYNTTGFFRFSIKFKDLGTYIILPQKNSLELFERQIQSNYQNKLNMQLAHNDTLTSVKKATAYAYQARINAQKDADCDFFKTLFSEYSLPSRNFSINSPFESYASSSGKCIVDTDYWKIDEDNAVYTNLLEFESSKSKFVPYLIEKVTKELFPQANVTRYKDGCHISGTL